jgi:phosphotransferase system enzyme I (PtsI)
MGQPIPQRNITLAGQVASPGLAAGPLVLLRESVVATPVLPTGIAGLDRLEAARALASAEIAELASGADTEAAEILEFQIAMLEDDSLVEPVREGVGAGGDLGTAWRAALDAMVAEYEAAEDAYFRGRAADIRDIRDRVLRHLSGTATERLPSGAIVVADDLTPSRFLEADWSGGGLALLRGSVSSHVAMLARARGVPMLVDLAIVDLAGHAQALLDAEQGALLLSPDDSARRSFDRRMGEAGAAREQVRQYLHRPAVTAKGERVTVLVNIADPAELAAIDPATCDGIGLTRTEFLFHSHAGLPDEAAQYAVYRRIVEWAGGKPVTIRTLDAGGDKPIPGLTLDGETNPFLGLRGIRLSLRRPEIFGIQLRALARAAAHGPLKVMLPMVTAPAEIAAARSLLDIAVAELNAAGITAAKPPLGIMVEVPAAAIAVDEFDADFFSIGSNDLVQYVTACSRDSSSLTALARPDGTAVLRLIRTVVEHGRRTGREVSLCGDMGGDVRYLPKLLDCGLRTVSVAPAALANAKATIAAHGAGNG